MTHPFIRTELLIKKQGLERLAACRVAVFGIGGVGGHAVEALARSGIGALDLYDDDTINLSNLNRQIIATLDTIGQYKVDAMKDRIASINPDCRVIAHRMFLLPETADSIDFSVYDYVIDAIDTVTAKLELAVRTKAAGIPLISAMGAGNKLDPTKFVVTDIQKTRTCPLAKVMRRELKKRGIEHLKVVYSTEAPLKPDPLPPLPSSASLRPGTQRRSTPGSIAFVPSVSGLIIAAEVVKDLLDPSFRSQNNRGS